MTERLILPALEVRAVDDGEDGRTLEGRILPYGEVIEVNGGKETFDEGVFDGTDPDTVALLWQHDPDRPIGRMTKLDDVRDGDAPGYYATFRLGDTTTARDALSLLKDGIIRGLSVGVIPDKTVSRKGVRVHRSARLVETSVVTFAAYNGAQATAVRKEDTICQIPIPTSSPSSSPSSKPSTSAGSKPVSTSKPYRYGKYGTRSRTASRRPNRPPRP